MWEKLLTEAVLLMEECHCENGCPNCIVIPTCGEHNHGLDKIAALKIGHALGLGRRSKSEIGMNSSGIENEGTDPNPNISGFVQSDSPSASFGDCRNTQDNTALPVVAPSKVF